MATFQAQSMWAESSYRIVAEVNLLQAYLNGLETSTRRLTYWSLPPVVSVSRHMNGHKEGYEGIPSSIGSNWIYFWIVDQKLLPELRVATFHKSLR